jgi:hypothetical protein
MAVIPDENNFLGDTFAHAVRYISKGVAIRISRVSFGGYTAEILRRGVNELLIE